MCNYFKLFIDLCWKGDYESVKFMLEDKKMDPTAENNYALHVSCVYGRNSVVEVLLKDPRIDPSAEDNTAIIVAANHGNHKIVDMLIKDPRVDPSAQENMALRVSASLGYHKVVDILLKDPRVDPYVDNNVAIRKACVNGNKKAYGTLKRYFVEKQKECLCDIGIGLKSKSLPVLLQMEISKYIFLVNGKEVFEKVKICDVKKWEILKILHLAKT